MCNNISAGIKFAGLQRVKLITGYASFDHLNIILSQCYSYVYYHRDSDYNKPGVHKTL